MIDVRGLFRLILSESCDFHLLTICYYSMPLALPFKTVQPLSSMLSHSLNLPCCSQKLQLLCFHCTVSRLADNAACKRRAPAHFLQHKKKVITGPGFLSATEREREAELLCAAIKLKLHCCLQWFISVNYEYSALVSIGICLIIYLSYS